MIPIDVYCENCGNSISVATYRKFIVCPACSSKIEFPGFEYEEIDRSSSMYANVKYEMDCPACRGPHMLLGPSGKNWRCHDCGLKIGKWEKFFGTFWFCDSCETYMNVQPGFTTKNKKWTCTECGFENSVTRKDIF